MWRQNLWTGGQDKRKLPRCNEVYYHAKSNPLFCPPVQLHSHQLKGIYTVNSAASCYMCGLTQEKTTDWTPLRPVFSVIQEQSALDSIGLRSSQGPRENGASPARLWRARRSDGQSKGTSLPRDSAGIRFYAVRSLRFWVSGCCTKWGIQWQFHSSYSRLLEVKI